jgi:glycine cleavage system H protein
VDNGGALRYLAAMNIPQDLRYSKDHEWVRVEGDVATVGITDFAQSELGDIVFVEVETEDEDLEVDAVFGTIEAVKTVSDMFMPLAGTVVELNAALEDNPALINEDPYGEGWIIKIKVEGGADMGHLLTAEAYAAEVG